MTPVNTFRILFNGLLGTEYPILEDRSYFATWSHPYSFIPLPSETDGQSSERTGR